VTSTLEIDGHRIAVSNLEKVLWPVCAFTKGQMLDYYVRVSPFLLPHLTGRPVTLRRLPDGIEAQSWYQNDCPPGAPEWLQIRHVEWPSGKRWEFCSIDDLPSLVWVVNLASIELHPFFARADALDEPTAVVFDLDPGQPADLVHCSIVALRLDDALKSMDLKGFAKTSGSVGMHVVVPLNSPHTWDESKAFARALAHELVHELPDLVVDKQSRSARRGKVLVDWLQNDPTRSTVAPYSLRAHGWPLVSTPVSWEEVRNAAGSSHADKLVFEPTSVLDRVERLGDHYEPVLSLEQRLPGA
jgi:bifunctional non-homologous end joining protein LigD